MKDRDKSHEDDLTPERMQKQCALVVDKLESMMDRAANTAKTMAKKSWFPWRRKSHMEFHHAAQFASSILHGAALVIRAMPSDHPVEISVTQASSNLNPDEPMASTKPKGVTLQ